MPTQEDLDASVLAELAALRMQVPGVAGCVVAGVDGLLMLYDTTIGTEPHDVAALAAGAHGISRTTGAVLGQGGFSDVTIHNQNGYLTVYAIGDLALLVVIGEGGLNIARLHLEARSVTAKLSGMLKIRPAHHM
ncbi:roadblock/LC7 domain-containing protein [Actinoplanes awajinensis]|uniref:Dynein regulation protein LC7 n=1 Tax=Actinoplanes awajinensis subsp. mycoplanecinus TaxID=135947 RepID=A0A101JM47_9ACTN|nr:roadblock/LC7 domain-containing protein [Actinoplanes awajinensis]KUL29178.1 dynein regulation protein LC7 [Actinoplanes awajinensis subsp. mycoplanecinus]